MNWLPEGYKEEKQSNAYMKLQEGENRIRILSEPIIGWEDWTADKKPVRFRDNEKPAKSIDPAKPVKRFWSFVVWNYKEERIQILHLTQASIRGPIQDYCEDRDWGNPCFYDIKITKKGGDTLTKYTVSPVPSKEVAPHIVEAFNARRCNLEALFTNQDPFSAQWDTYTEGRFSKKQEVKIETGAISEHELQELRNILDACGEEFNEKLQDWLSKDGIASLEAIPRVLLPKVRKRALEELAKIQVNQLPF
jgi:hypothetical protein